MHLRKTYGAHMHHDANSVQATGNETVNFAYKSPEGLELLKLQRYDISCCTFWLLRSENWIDARVVLFLVYYRKRVVEEQKDRGHQPEFLILSDSAKEDPRNIIAKPCDFARLGHLITVPYVVIVHMNENWGGLSSTIPCESVDWGTLTDTMRKPECSMAIYKK